MKLPLSQIASCVASAGEFSSDTLVSGYSIDSRTIVPGELFFAVRGDRLDGHDFVSEALRKGAAGAVVGCDQAHRFSGCSPLLVVQDPLVALQTLGREVRRLWGKPVIAVTGSAGKTTTKEIIARLLSTRYHVLKSEKNLNNHFGLPLQLLRLESEHDLAVVELGMSHAGEIAALAQLACPNLGVVTNVAPVHLGFFASVAEIAQAKKELIDSLGSGAIAVLNGDDEYVSQFGRDFRGRIVSFGLHPAPPKTGVPETPRQSSDWVCAEAVEELGFAGSRFILVAGSDRHLVTLPLLGRHNIYNVLAAAAVAMQYGITATAVAEEVARLSPVDNRGEILEIGGATVVNDCYNSNPRALDYMVDALAGMAPGTGGRRIVVAGEMLELGPAGEELHRACGRRIAERGIDVLLGVRGLANFMVEAVRQCSATVLPSHPKAEFFETPDLAAEWLAREVRPGDVVLLKASRGVRLERALQIWRAKRTQSVS
jgi:UDP-N-acetylmuramoyl-tripeptide--D-alanyl-D-alanine ligase